MSTRTLFNISDDLLALENLLIESEGEVTDNDAESAIDQWFAELGDARDSKLEAYAFLIRAIESDAEAVKAEADRLKSRQKALENRASRLKERLEVFFQIHSIEKIDTTHFTFAMQKPGGKPKVGIAQQYLDAPEELPEGLRRVKFEPDLVAIRERLEASDADVAEWAWFEQPVKKLRIR